MQKKRVMGRNKRGGEFLSNFGKEKILHSNAGMSYNKSPKNFSTQTIAKVQENPAGVRGLESKCKIRERDGFKKRKLFEKI